MRGICCAFLTKRGIPYEFEVKSNRGLDHGFGRMSRDILELHIKEGEKTKMVIMLVHLKSKISSDIDFMGLDKRKAECQTIAHQYLVLKECYACPIVLAGDLNGVAIQDNPEEEFKPLYETDMIDVHDLNKSTDEERTTFVYFNAGKANIQLDYIFLSHALHDKVKETYTYRFKNDYGDVMGLPGTFTEKKWNPSDHYPVVVDLNI